MKMVSRYGLGNLSRISENVISERNRMKPIFAAIMKTTESRKYVFLARIVKSKAMQEAPSASTSKI